MYRYFENLIQPFDMDVEPTPPATYLEFMRAQLRPYRRVLPWMIISGVFVAVMEVGLIFYSGRVIDLMEGSAPGIFWAEHGLELLFALVFILLLRPAVIFLSRLLLEQTLASNMQDHVRWRAHKHMLGQSANFYQNDFAGRLSNRVMQVGPAVEDTVYMGLEGIWYALTYVAGAAIILSQIDIRLGLPMVIWLAIYCLYVRSIAKRVTVASEKWSDARSLTTGRVVDAYSNIETVKLFAQKEAEMGYALSGFKRLRLRFARFLRLMTEMSLGLNLINGLLITGVVGPAIYLWSVDAVTLGGVSAALALTFRLNGMTGWIMWVTIRLFEHAGVVREALRSIAVPHAVTDKPGAVSMDVKHGKIEFRKLAHHYGKETGGIEDISLTVHAGEKVGLIGRSGAGKSSLVNLLLRFRDAEHGDILIDDQSIKEVTQDSLRASIGMVTQDNSLLHRSVRANILYGNPNATEEQLIAATKRAEAYDFIQELVDPKGGTGFDAQVGERGVKLSGGQRQRIAIARVILKDAPILVLDEATSALDSEVEAAIQETLYGVMQGKTVIAIAHRLSTIARMDRIVVLDEGRIVEAGTHNELLELNGTYAGLWARQSGGFLGQEDAAE